MAFKWESVWYIKNAFVQHFWSWPIRENPSHISLSGEFYEFDTHLDGADHLFLNVEGEEFDEPEDLHLNIHLRDEAESQNSYLKYKSHFGDYSSGILNIEMFVGPLEYAMFAAMLVEEHKNYGICVTQMADDCREDKIAELGIIVHIDVGIEREINISKFSAFRMD